MIGIRDWRRLHKGKGFGYAPKMMPRKHPESMRKALSAAGLCIVCAIGLAAISSCSSKQQMLLRSDGSGSVQFRVTIDKVLMNAANGLSSGGSSSPQPGQFDIPKIRSVFSKNPALKLQSISSPGKGVLSGKFTFSSIGSLFQNDSGTSSEGIVTFTRGPSRNVLKVHITRTNFAQIADLAGMTKDPLYQMFGPEQNAATSLDDLNQMMVYVLGESGPAALKASSIDVEVQVAGRIISQKGGVLQGNKVRFHIPLVRLLLLKTPLDFSITFS